MSRRLPGPRGVWTEAYALNVQRSSASRARASGREGVCVKDARVVLVIRTAVASVVEDAEAKVGCGVEGRVEARNTQFCAVKCRRSVCRGRESSGIIQGPHSDYR